MLKMKIPVLLAAMVAVLAVSAAPAMALKAFVAKEAGQVKGKNLNTHVFTTKFGTVECKETVSKGSVPAGSTASVKQTFEFKGCKAFGFVSATISPAEYLFKFSGSEAAGKGTVELQNTVTIKASTCTTTVAGPQLFKESISFENSGNNIKGKAAATGISYVGKGFGCEGSGTNGEYKGEEEIAGNKPPEKISVE
jgi:hypothetical protein